jgi:transposase-like protein
MARGGGRSPFAITLRAGERRFLKARARQATAPYRQVVRARIVLLAAAGLTNSHIAGKLGIAPNTVVKWRKRFWTEGVDGLADRKRPGRPRVFGAAVVACAKAIACELPATRGVPLWPLESRRAAHRAAGDRPGRCRLDDDAVALAARGCAPAVAPPPLDLPA